MSEAAQPSTTTKVLKAIEAKKSLEAADGDCDESGPRRLPLPRSDGFSASIIDELMKEAHAEGLRAGRAEGYRDGRKSGFSFGWQRGIEECNAAWRERLRQRFSTFQQLNEAAAKVKHRSKLISRVKDLAEKALNEHMEDTR